MLLTILGILVSFLLVGGSLYVTSAQEKFSEDSRIAENIAAFLALAGVIVLFLTVIGPPFLDHYGLFHGR